MSTKMKGSSVIINLFFNMVVKGGYSTNRMKRGVVRGIKTSFYIQQLLKNCALLYMGALWAMVHILNLINFFFMDLHCSVPISLVSGEVKQRTNYTLTTVRINNKSMIRISTNLSLLN